MAKLERKCACGARMAVRSQTCKACMLKVQTGGVRKKPRVARCLGTATPESIRFVASDLRSCGYCMRKHRNAGVYCDSHLDMEAKNRGYLVEDDN